MISGVRRRKTAEESSGLFFQTTKLIASHFRRESDKKKIYELCNQETTLKELLIASSAVHAFHYLGVHTINTLESGNISLENADLLEKREKKEIFEEISELLNDSIDLEINLMNLENDILEFIIQKIMNISEEFSKKNIDELREDLENQILEILHNYPNVCFFDFVGDLSGLAEEIKSEIIQRSSKLRMISQEIEESLTEEIKENEYIELALTNGIHERMKKDFEIENLKDLVMETVPMRKLLTKIINNLLNLFPTSKRALDVFVDAIHFKKTLYSEFKEYNSTKTDYEIFEYEISKKIQEKIRELSKNKTSHEIIYFLEGLTEKNFAEILEIFTRFGITDISAFLNLLHIDKDRFFSTLKLYGIEKMEIKKLSSPIDNPLTKAESALLKLKEKIPEIENKTIKDFIDNPQPGDNKILSEIEKEIQMSPEDLIKLFKKKRLIDQKIIKPLDIANYSSLVLLFEHQNILDNISREIFFAFFSKISRQISRILESYIKIKQDQSIYLLGLKKISSTNENWVKVKIEELIIERLMKRQRELAIVFNAERDPFLVNGFMLARFLNTKLNDAAEMLKKEPSVVYFGVKPLTLPMDLISPVSYCIAFDLLERYKVSQERRLLHVESIAIKENAKIEEKKAEIKKAQQDSTFNWIDRKISSSIMRVSSLNPSLLYWTEKDNSMCSDNIKLHSELQNVMLCATCYNLFDNESCPEHPENCRSATSIDLFTHYYYFALNRIKELWQKTKVPTFDELRLEVNDITKEVIANRLKTDPSTINEAEIQSRILEGDRWEIANKISGIIGQKLDKTLYKKFKAKPK